MGRKRTWTEEQDRILRDLYPKSKAVDIAKILDKTPGAVRSRCFLNGLREKHPPVLEHEIEKIKKWYAKRNSGEVEGLSLESLSAELGRTITHISGIAKSFGLTKKGRLYSDEAKEKISKSQKKIMATKIHPRGMLGKQHSAESRRSMSIHKKENPPTKEKTIERVRKFRETRQERYGTPEKEKEITLKRARTNISRYGTTAPHMKAGTNAYKHIKAGRRSDIGNFYFRSSWEANYARCLNRMITQGLIASWEYEAKTFVFDKSASGISSYTPDFKVLFPDGRHEWHEVKGWMNEKSLKNIECMGMYFPEEILIVIGYKEYKSIEVQKSLIPNWE